MPKYLTISDDLQIVRGEGCGFLPGPPQNTLVSVERIVTDWVAENPNHPDIAEAQRWLDGVASRLEHAELVKDRIKKEAQLEREVRAFMNQIADQYWAKGDTWASWKVTRYHMEEIGRFRKEARRRLGLD
jgi:hypothetical protein